MLAKDHIFGDGNKRTAMRTSLSFSLQNGYRIGYQRFGQADAQWHVLLDTRNGQRAEDIH